jgi:hypothetical protein
VTGFQCFFESVRRVRPHAPLVEITDAWDRMSDIQQLEWQMKAETADTHMQTGRK